MFYFFLILGILFLLYFILIAFFVGHGTNFFFIWLFLGTAFVGMAFLLKKGLWQEWFPLWFRRLATVGGVLLLALWVLVEGLILSGFRAKGEPNLTHLVVLGAQMKTNGPSRALQYRLDAVIEYLEQNPDTEVVVSGGQGRDEPVSEAQGMFEYLTTHGIDGNRIFKEDRSTSTVENLTFSARYLDPENDRVGVVTNNFHAYRAVKTAQKAGYRKVCGIAARGDFFLTPNNMMREFLSIVKDFVTGNM